MDAATPKAGGGVMELELINERYEFLRPEYATEYSSAADLKTAIDITIRAKARAKVPTGVRLAGLPEDNMDIQVRARSGLAHKYGLMLVNGIGTIDADYKDEICVLLYNSGDEDVVFKVGDRIAQIILTSRSTFKNVPVKVDVRKGGFGSTGT
jgi:dUTP pyrophosphatase